MDFFIFVGDEKKLAKFCGYSIQFWGFFTGVDRVFDAGIPADPWWRFGTSGDLQWVLSFAGVETTGSLKQGVFILVY